MSADNQVSVPLSYPAPTLGLVTTRAISEQQAGSASVLENFLPTLTGARIRGGSVRIGSLSGGGQVVSAFGYRYAGFERLFMATDQAIYDVTPIAVMPSPIAPAVSGLTSGEWSCFQHTMPANSYLIAVNGRDDRRVFNGSTWSTSPAITFAAGETTTSANFSHGWLFKNRQWYVKAGSLDAYYLPVGVVGGQASVFPLGGVFPAGGFLLTGFSWSVESGDGMSAMCVFVSSEGEVALYAGSNPDSSTDFALKGVHQIGKPLGKTAFLPVGGDVWIATTDALIPLSQILARGSEASAITAISRPIEREWRTAAGGTPNGWTITPWREKNIVFFSFPENTALASTTFVINTLTNRWSILTNWRAQCYATNYGALYFGSAGGDVWQGDVSGTDDGQPFRAIYLSSFQPAGQFGQRKSASLAHIYFRAREKPRVKLFSRADFDLTVPYFLTASEAAEELPLWDAALWDRSVWDGKTTENPFSFRQNVRANGDMLAVGCVIVSNGGAALQIEVDAATLQVEQGEASA